jgi:hypothetical protein
LFGFSERIAIEINSLQRGFVNGIYRTTMETNLPNIIKVFYPFILMAEKHNFTFVASKRIKIEPGLSEIRMIATGLTELAGV